MNINKIVKEIVQEISGFINSKTMTKDQIASYVVGSTMMRDDYDDIIVVEPMIRDLAEMALATEIIKEVVELNMRYHDIIHKIEQIKTKYNIK